MKQRLIGVFRLGHEQIEVFAREGIGGEFYTCPEDGKLPRIKVGFDLCWKDVVSVLHHEAMEFAMMRLECRFNPGSDFARDHSSYLFVMTHPQFSEAAARTAWFLADSLPRMGQVFRVWCKNRKPKRS